MRTCLPSSPDLSHLRGQARRLQRAVRRGDDEALAHVSRHHGELDPGDQRSFPLSTAQLVVARAYRFPSWPRLVPAST